MTWLNFYAENFHSFQYVPILFHGKLTDPSHPDGARVFNGVVCRNKHTTKLRKMDFVKTDLRLQTIHAFWVNIFVDIYDTLLAACNNNSRANMNSRFMRQYEWCDMRGKIQIYLKTKIIIMGNRESEDAPRDGQRARGETWERKTRRAQW